MNLTKYCAHRFGYCGSRCPPWFMSLLSFIHAGGDQGLRRMFIVPPLASSAALSSGVIYVSVRSMENDASDSSFSGTHAQLSSEKSHEFICVRANAYPLPVSRL